jgi:TP901 family phage tail tape measure protein
VTRSRIIAGRAVIILEAQDQIDKTLKSVRGKLLRFSNSVGQLGQNMFRGGFFGALASGSAISAFVRFDDKMRELQVVLEKFDPAARRSDKALMALENRIKMLGRVTSFTTVQVADAAVELGRAGLKESAIEGSLQAILDLARGTGVETSLAAKIFVRAISAYTKGGADFQEAIAESTKIVSQFIKTTNNSVIGLEDLEAALRYTQGSAATLGVSLAETLAILGELANQGLVGSIGGTSLNTALLNLIKKRDQLTAQGIEIQLTEQGGVNIISTLQVLFAQLQKFSLTQRAGIIGDLFNIRGGRAVQAARELDNIIRNLENVKAASDEARRAADLREGGLGGALRRLYATVEQLGIGLTDLTQNILQPFTETLRGLTNALNQLSQQNPALAGAIFLSPAILLGSGLALIGLSKGLFIAATAAGVLRGALTGVMQLLARGFGAQMLTAAAIGKNLKGITSAKLSTPSFLLSGGSQRTRSAKDSSGMQRAIANREQALAAQRAAAAEDLLSTAEKNRKSSADKLKSSVDNNKRSYMGFTAALDQNNRSLKQNLINNKNNSQAARRVGAYQESIARLRNEIYNIEQDLNKTTVGRGAGGGLRNIPPANAAALNHEREKRLFQIRKLEEEITKEGILPRQKFEERQRQLLRERHTINQNILQTQREAVALGKGREVIETRYQKQLAKGQDLLVASSKSRQAAEGALGSTFKARKGFSLGAMLRPVGSAASGAIKGLPTVTKGLFSFGKGLLTVANTARRFVFSFSGVFTLLELSLLFGDRLPGLATILNRFGMAFTNAFKAIANIAVFAKGPIELLRLAIAAFTEGRQEIGIDALKDGFMGLVSIIGNQLTAAWGRFKQALGSVLDLLSQTFTTIWSVVSGVVDAIGAMVSTTVAQASTVGGSLMSMFGGGEGFTFDGLVNGLRDLIADLGVKLLHLLDGLAMFVEQMGLQAGLFVLDFEAMLRRVLPFVGGDQEGLAARRQQLQDASVQRQVAIRTASNENIKAIRDAQKRSASKDGGELASRSARSSVKTFRESLEKARKGFQKLANLNRQDAIRAAQEQDRLRQSNGIPQFQGQAPAIKQAIQQVLPYAAALVTSAQSSQGNILRFGQGVEQEQLNEQRTTNDLLRQQLKLDGGLAFGQ